MRIRWAVSIVTLLFALVPPASGQHARTEAGERKPDQNQYQAVSPPVTYRIQADLAPESSMVSGLLEILYANRTRDTIREVYLDLGRGSYLSGAEVDFYGAGVGESVGQNGQGRSQGYCHIDSILYRATRLEQAPVMVTDSIMRIRLTDGIAPGETGSLVIWFHTRLTGGGELSVTNRQWYPTSTWFPKLVMRGYGAASGRDGEDTRCGDSPARYEAVITIDSAYDLITPGTLLNEKEHYGVFERAKDDTVFVDVLRHMFAFSKDHPYTPVFEGGVKRYYVELPSGFAFPIVVAKGVQLDRAYANDLPVEVYYPEALAGRVQKKVAEASRSIVAKYQSKLGEYPYPKLVVLVFDDNCALYGENELVVISKDETGDKRLYSCLAVGIAQGWFGDLPRRSGGSEFESVHCSFAPGVAFYVAAENIADSPGEEGPARLGEYDIDQRRCDASIGWSVDFAGRVYNGVPWEMRMLRIMAGDSLLWNAIRTYSREFRLTYPGLGRFGLIVNEESGQDYDWFFKEWNRPGARLDYYFSGVAFQADDSGVTVSGFVRNDGNAYMPVELAFVERPGDTLIDTLAYDDFDQTEGQAAFSVHLPGRPRIIVIDPHYFLNDSRRDNNYQPKAGRPRGHEQPVIPIPRFRR